MMKKFLFSLLFLFAISLISKAQNPLELYRNGELLGENITVSDFNEIFGEIKFEANVKNNTEHNVNLYVAREVISTVDSTSNYFCWAGSCLPSDIDTSLNYQTIAPGQMSADGEFSAHYTPDGHEGATTIKYTFYDESDSNIKVTITVNYEYYQNQPLEIYYEGVPVEDTVLVDQYDQTFGEIKFEANVKNNTDRDVNLYVARKVISEIEGTSNYFCWAGNCLPSDIDTSLNYQTIAPGQMSADGEFSAHYNPQTIEGITIVKYTFFEENDDKNSVSVVVKFKYDTQGIDDNVYSDISFSNAYPNPSTNNITIDYKLSNNVNNAQIKIVNLLGSVVKTINLKSSDNRVTFNVSNLQKGIYFYSIILNNEIYKTKKLIIK
jgi:hypothetical protein